MKLVLLGIALQEKEQPQKRSVVGHTFLHSQAKCPSQEILKNFLFLSNSLWGVDFIVLSGSEPFFLVSLCWRTVVLECLPGSVEVPEIFACVLCATGEYWRWSQLKISIVLRHIFGKLWNYVGLGLTHKIKSTIFGKIKLWFFQGSRCWWWKGWRMCEMSRTDDYFGARDSGCAELL